MSEHPLKPFMGQGASGGGEPVGALEAYGGGAGPKPAPKTDKAAAPRDAPDVLDDVAREALRSEIIRVLQTIYDPEISVNIYDLGLIYDLRIDGSGAVEVEMTLTAPACPAAEQIVREVADDVGMVEGVSRSHVVLVWDPPWTTERLSEAAELELGFL